MAHDPHNATRGGSRWADLGKAVAGALLLQVADSRTPTTGTDTPPRTAAAALRAPMPRVLLVLAGAALVVLLARARRPRR